MNRPASTDMQPDKPATEQALADLKVELKDVIEALKTDVYQLDTRLVALEERVDMLEVRMNLRFDELRALILHEK